MDDLISRQKAIEAMKHVIYIGDKQLTDLHNDTAVMLTCQLKKDALNLAICEIKQLPSAEPQERKVGRWSNECGYPHVKCTVCGEEENAFSTYGWKFCPNCGARMEVEHETD